MSASRHRWSEPQRFPAKTERYCRRCGLIKVTRHVAAAPNERGVRDRDGRLVWTEWWRTGADDDMPARLAHVKGTPRCEPVGITA
jgi:hypothetical protein